MYGPPPRPTLFPSPPPSRSWEAGGYKGAKAQAPGGNQWAGQLVGSAGLSFFLGPSHRESPYPEVPKEKRDSILAAGGKVPEARPRGGPTYEQRSSDWQHKWYWGGQAGIMGFRTNVASYSFEPQFGGHLVVSGKRTALYASFEQSLFLSPRHVTIIQPDGSVSQGNVP